MVKPLIVLNGINKIYQAGEERFLALKKISLKVNAGDLLAIVGPSGSGKSTLMNIIGLLDQADEGEYLLNDRNIAGLTANESATLRNRYIGFVFQQFNLLPRYSAQQNIALPLSYRSLSNKEINQRVMKTMARVGMLTYAKYRPNQLSGGQQQRIALARALVTEPQVILADEPTGALDSRTGNEMMALFLKLHQEGRTIIIITHDEPVAALCKRRIVLADGEIVEDSRVS